MFKRSDYYDFLEELHRIPRTIVLEGEGKCAFSGLIETRYLSGCTSCAILSEEANIAAITHFESIRVKEHLREIKRLLTEYPTLKDAQNIAFFWNENNRENRYNPKGDVYRLYCDLKRIFKNREVEEIPYPGCLDWYAIHIDTGRLIIFMKDR